MVRRYGNESGDYVYESPEKAIKENNSAIAISFFILVGFAGEFQIFSSGIPMPCHHAMITSLDGNDNIFIQRETSENGNGVIRSEVVRDKGKEISESTTCSVFRLAGGQ
ncbi:complement component C7 isoform X1 [Prionailurus iriomotensis]